jgi:hypothetical protein
LLEELDDDESGVALLVPLLLLPGEVLAPLLLPLVP